MKRIISSILLMALISIPLCTCAKTVNKKYDSHGNYQGKYVTEGSTTKEYSKHGNYESKYVQSNNGKIKHYSKNGNLIGTYK